MRTWNQRALAGNVNECGRKMLAPEEEKTGKELQKEREKAEKAAAAAGEKCGCLFDYSL